MTQTFEYKWLKKYPFYPVDKDYLSKLIKLDGSMPMIKNCWFGTDTTTILWTDGTKTTVKCQDGDSLDDEKGVLACIAKKAYGNTGKFNNYVSKAIEQGEDNFLKMCNRKMKKDKMNYICFKDQDGGITWTKAKKNLCGRRAGGE